MGNTGRWTKEFLEAKRAEGDPTADKVIETVFGSGDMDAVNNLMRGMVRNEDMAPDALPPVVRDYLQTTAALPEWSDPAKIQLAQEVFCEFGPHIVTVLLCGSLPECYACGKGAEVLNMTNLLSGQPHRRISETAQFVLDVMAPGGLAPSGFGIRTTQKVRLMHAAIRNLARHSDRMQPEWGTPINQEDLAGTLMTFSIVAIDGLKKLNITLTPEQQEAYLHVWNNVGHILGIQTELLPTDVQDARDLIQAIREHQHLRSDAGIALSTSLLEFMTGLVPHHAMNGLIHALVWHLSGEDVAEILAVARPDWEGILLGPVEFANGLTAQLNHRVPVMEKITQLVHMQLLEGLVFVDRGGSRPPFRIPESLCDQWSVSPAARARTLGGSQVPG